MTTTDWGLVAYLRYRGYEFRHDEENKKAFYFAYPRDELKSAESDYYLSEAKAVTDILKNVVLPLTKK